MRTTPATLEDVRDALDTLTEMVESRPRHVRSSLRSVTEEIPTTHFHLEGTQRRAERALARDRRGGRQLLEEVA